MNITMDADTTFIGDVLLTFNANGQPIVGRSATAEWLDLAQDGCWTLCHQDPASDWQGFPFQFFTASSWRFWLIGELYGYGQKQSQVHDALAKLTATPSAAVDLNGHFILLAWDQSSRRWHLWTDRFGTLHAYYAANARRAAIGTFFSAVATVASRRQLDWHALAGFFAFGFFPSDQTYFNDVRILAPATHYLFAENGQLIAQERYWHWHYAPNYRRSSQDTMAEFAEVFAAVMTDLLQNGRVAVPISGGLDSRTTVAVLDRNGKIPRVDRPATSIGAKVWAYSYGYSDDSVETRIAARIARARHLPFQSFTIAPYLFDRLDEVLRSTEGFQDVTQCRQASVVADIGAHADYVIAAHWGDVWLDTAGFYGDDMGRNPGENQLLDFVVQKMLKAGHDWLVRKLCRPQLGAVAVDALLRDLLQPTAANLASIAEPDFWVKALKTEQWSFRWTTASLRMFQPAAFPRLPFYDTRLADFFCTVPTDFVRGRRLQIDYLKTFAPDLARITWQAYDANLFNYRHFSSWRLPIRVYKKIRRTLTHRPVIERNWQVQFGGPVGRCALEQHLLRPGLRLHDLVAPAEIRTLLDDFFTAPLQQGRGYTVSMLLTFAAWLERYG